MADRSILIQGLIELHLAGKGGDEAVASMRQINAQALTLQNEFKGAEKAVDSTTASFTRMASAAKVVAGIFAAGVVTNFLRDSLVGFARTERQALAVERQIKALGQAAEGSGFRGFIEQLSNASGIVDDELVPAFQRALATFKDYGAAQEALSIASKFAAAGIGDVASNVEALNRFFLTGSARSLTAFNINVKAGEESVLDLNEGLKLLKDQLAITGDGFDDSQKDILEWANRIDQAKDSIGRATGALINLVQRGGTFLGEGINKFISSTEDLNKQRVGEALLNELSAKAVADKKSALAAKFSDEQSKRDLKGAKDTAEKVLDLNEESETNLLKQRISFYEKGSDERIALELELNRKLEAAAIANAKSIGAKTNDIAKLFAAQRGDIIASASESQAEKDAREAAAGDTTGTEAGRIAQLNEIETFIENERKKTKAAKDEAEKRKQIAEDEAETRSRLARESFVRDLQLTAGAGTALAGLFEKNKAFAIAVAIMNTALGITEVWTDKTLSHYQKIAATIIVAASGAAQIKAIRGTSLSGGGGGAGAIAAQPTTQATAPGQSAQISGTTAAGLSGRSGAGGDTIINIGNAFGDRQSMVRLSRQLDRIARNNQSVIR